MKQRPILFSTEMVKAILDVRKTQTRRVIHPQPEQTIAAGKRVLQVSDFCTGFPIGGQAYYWKENGCWNSSTPFKCPYGQTGDVLWVRETFMRMPREGFFQYKAHHSSFKSTDLKIKLLKEEGLKWKPAIHMPKDACRLMLKNKSVKAQRISEISEEDCIAEGIECVGEDLEFGGTFYPGKWYRNYGDFGYTFLKPKESFITLWQSINGVPKPIQETVNGKLKTVGFIVYPFNDEYAEEFNGLTHWKNKPLTVVVNPWVWVIEFERVEGGVK